MNTTASNKFTQGPAMVINTSSTLGLRKLLGLTGTGLAQPIRNPASAEPDMDRKIIINGINTVPIGSICTSGFKEIRPSDLAVSSPHLEAIHAWPNSWNVSITTRATY